MRIFVLEFLKEILPSLRVTGKSSKSMKCEDVTVAKSCFKWSNSKSCRKLFNISVVRCLSKKTCFLFVIGWGSIIGWGSNSHFLMLMLIISQCYRFKIENDWRKRWGVESGVVNILLWCYAGVIEIVFYPAPEFILVSLALVS